MLEGKVAPDFQLLDQNEKTHQLSDYQGQYVLLFFYPKDMTSGCTREAQNFRDNLSQFEEMKVKVFGISCDDVAQHQKFVAKENLNFDLLADTGKEVVQKYGVWVEKSMYGNKYMGIQRDSFLIGPDGVVVKHYVKARPADHTQKVLKDLKKLI